MSEFAGVQNLTEVAHLVLAVPVATSGTTGHFDGIEISRDHSLLLCVG